ncbi:MAG TPA: hypothetical protein VF703_17565 [Pyrinomonadaceae bacterium]|jgi:hypothetical protein
MSDYLWDKTGEPEEDVAQLETLLGALKFQPRPLELPATAMPTATAARRATIFSRPRLALAASLLLTLLAGTWLITRQGETPKNQLAEAKQGTPAGANRQAETAADPRAATHENASIPNTESPKPRADEAVEASAATVAASKPRRTLQRRQQPATKRQAVTPRGEENLIAPREEVAVQGARRWQVEQPLTAQQREATEQLMLALTLASAKLNYAQREMHEIGRAGK